MLMRSRKSVGPFILLSFLIGLCFSAPLWAQERELVRNGNLKSLEGWTIQEWMKPTGRRGEVTLDRDGVKFRNTGANSRMGIMQPINADVSRASHLILRAVVKADVQTLTGTGWQGREAPIEVTVTYTDVQGVKRVGLGSMANPPESQANRMFWHGFYYANPTGQSQIWNGTRVAQGRWYTYSFDLMSLNPRPRIIHDIGAGGSGWPTREGKISFISLKMVGGAPPPPPPPPAPANLTGVWNCNDGGRYYIRQLGSKVWWFGENSPASPVWSNVAHGDRVGSQLRLEWADVPKGRIMNSGILILNISGNRLTAAQKTGGFGGSVWTR